MRTGRKLSSKKARAAAAFAGRTAAPRRQTSHSAMKTGRSSRGRLMLRVWQLT
jgi:hypothetical protein